MTISTSETSEKRIIEEQIKNPHDLAMLQVCDGTEIRKDVRDILSKRKRENERKRYTEKEN